MKAENSFGLAGCVLERSRVAPSMVKVKRSDDMCDIE